MSNKENYLSIYLKDDELDLPKALDRMAKKSGVSRNQLIKDYLINLARLTGELKK